MIRKLLWMLAVLGAVQSPLIEAADLGDRPVRILHVMSYHSPWRWTDGQLAGFKEGLGDIPAEYRVFQLDSKRFSSTSDKAARGQEARAIVDSWKPDLIYTSDDDAQDLVTRHYLNTPIKQIFSGVNKAPAVYGFDKANNVSGVLEHEHFVESVRLLKHVVPELKRLVVVLDDAPMWGPVTDRIKTGMGELPGISIVAWDTIRTFDEFKARIKAYPAMADGIALIGIFNFKDANGKNVPYQDVLRWTAENSTLPDLGFWIDRVHFGTLVAVTVSEKEQGVAAGRIARAILREGKAPATLPMLPTTKGAPVISLARAKKLGLKIRSEQLLSAEIITSFEWDKP